MQREDVERLARLLDALSGDCAHTDGWEDGGATCTAAAAALRALLAERDAAFAAGQEEMRGLVAKVVYKAWQNCHLHGEVQEMLVDEIRALPIKPRP